MPFTTNPHEHDITATSPSWLAPFTVLVAWLVSLLQQIANLRRIRATTKFKPHWAQSWTDLRRLEWHRDQMLAQGAALLLAGKTLDDADAILSDPPPDYGGPRPRTPFEMQRRFLAIAAWLKDPEAMIRRHAARIAKRAGVDLSNPLAAHGSTDAALRAAAHHELVAVAPISNAQVALMLSRPRSGRPSTCRAEAQRRREHARGLVCARGPPICRDRLPTTPPESARFRERARLRVIWNRPIHAADDHPRSPPSTQVAGRQTACAGASLKRQGRRRMTPATLVPTDFSATTRRTSGDTR